MYWFDLIILSLMDWSNYFLLIIIHWVQAYDSTQLTSIRRIKVIEFQSLLRINFNYLDSDVIPFNFQMDDGKRLPQSCSENIIGLAHTSYEILKDGDVLIFMVVLITLYSPQFKCDRTGILLSKFCAEVHTIWIWLYVQCQSATLMPLF